MEQGNTSGASSSVSPALPKSMTPEDLLDAYDAEVVEAKEEVDAEVSKQAQVAEELPKKIAANNIVKKLNSKEQIDEDFVTPEPEAVADGEKKAEEAAADEEVPAYKAKFGEEEFEVPEDAVIPTEINGKKIDIIVKDAIKAVLHQEKWNRELDRRISVVSDREKRFAKERNDIQSRLKQVTELAEQGDHILGIRLLAEMSGKDPIAYEKEVLGTLGKLTEVYSNMSEDQRAAYFASRKAEYLEKKLNESREQTKLTEGKEELRGHVKKLTEQVGITEEVFIENYKELSKLIKDGIAPNDTSPEAVIEHYQLSQHVQKVGKAIGNVNKALAQDPEFVDDLINETRSNLNFTVEDIEKIIRDVLSVDSKSVENLNRKVQKAQVHGGPRAQSGQASSEKKQVEVREDDELYEHFFGKAKLSPRR